MDLFDRFSKISRRRKLELFFDSMKPTGTEKVLDVGGEIQLSSEHDSYQLIDNYPWKSNLSVINISSQHIQNIQKKYPEIDAKVGDACNLPWPDNYFDIVYSNAVIEHVGNFDKQKQMAFETMRVGRKWFVSTPNRWYPFEFHQRLPFVTWLPFHGYLKFGRIICYNHVRRKYVFGIKQDCLRLMTASELKRCFPSSLIIKQQVTFMSETLIAVGEKK